MDHASPQRLDAWRQVVRADPDDDAGRRLRDEILDLLQGDEDPFGAGRSHHVGVSALVTTSDNTEVLLCRPVGQLTAEPTRRPPADLAR